MNSNIKNILACILLLSLSSLVTAQHQYLKISEFVKEHEEIVLHAFGQGHYRWDTEAIPYFEVMEDKPVFYSSYLQLADIKSGDLSDLTQFGKYVNGWFDNSSGVTYNFIPIVGVTASSIDLDRRVDSLSAEFFNILGITEEMYDQYQIEEPTYSLTIFSTFLQYPDLWELVSANLTDLGFDLSEIDLEELLQDGSDEAVYQLISLRDSALTLANENLLERDFFFSDLEILNGTFDQEIIQLADTLKTIDSPILLRFLHESIAGISRNTIYSSKTFRSAFQHFVDVLKANNTENVEFIFHPNFSNPFSLEEWYPGDEYVDWVATSWFQPVEDFENYNKESDFALSRDKPFMIVESCPSYFEYRPDNMFYLNLWEEWFIPYFDFIKNDQNTKVFVYIGIDWGSTPGNFNDWGNTRIQENPDILEKYSTELNNEVYLHNKEFWELYNKPTDVQDEELPEKFKLFQNYPNPFNPTTKIKFNLPKREKVLLKVYDSLGREIQTLVDNVLNAGEHEVEFYGENLSSGIYLYRLQNNLSSISKKMLLIQ